MPVTAANLLLIAALPFCSACTSTQPRFVPALSSFAVDPPPKVPFCTLAADRPVAAKGEEVVLTLSIHNPTGRAIYGPAVSQESGSFVSIGGEMWSTWTNALDGTSQTIPSATDICPPIGDSIPARSSRSYRCRWRSTFSGDGTIILKFGFRFDSREATPAVELRSR